MVKDAEQTAWGYTSRAQYLRHAWARYRLSEDRWWEFWTRQEGKCAGCEQPLAHPWIKQATFGVKPEIDHDHGQVVEDEFRQINLNYVRGLLCGKCNNFLGKIRDNQATLRRLAEYLKAYGQSLENFK